MTTTIHANHEFCTFPCCRCTTTTWNFLISCFMEEVNTGERLYFSSFWTKLQSFRVQLQKNSPTFLQTEWGGITAMKCETAYWLPKWRFCSCHLRGCLDSLLAQLFFPWSKLWLVFEWFAEKSFRLDGMETIKGEYWFLTFTSKNCVIFLCRTRQVSREEKTLKSFLDMSPDKWVEASYEVCWILNVDTQKMDDVI